MKKTKRPDGGAFRSIEEFEEAQAMTIDITLDEMERQTCVLALEKLAEQRPGWRQMLLDIAKKFEGGDLFEAYEKITADAVALALNNGKGRLQR